MNAHDMVQRCFRHQNPDAYGGVEIGEPAVPMEMRYGRDPSYIAGEALPEEQVGNPDVVRLDSDEDIQRQQRMAEAERQYWAEQAR